MLISVLMMSYFRQPPFSQILCWRMPVCRVVVGFSNGKMCYVAMNCPTVKFKNMSNVENIKSANELESERVLGLIYEIANRPPPWIMPYRTHDELRQLNDSLERGRGKLFLKLWSHIRKSKLWMPSNLSGLCNQAV